MNKGPLVSVVIPFYDHVDWLEEAVDSVLYQTYDNKELIIINDGSKERMDEFLQKYERQIVYIQKENGGPASARNLGIEIAKGEYIAFLDSDDIWFPNKLEVQISEMLKEKADWSCSNYCLFGTDNADVHIIPNQNDTVLIDYEPDKIATPTVVIKSNILLSNSRLRFNKEMRFGQDAYLWMHMIAEYKLLVINSILAKVRIRGNNAGKRAYVQLVARAKLWECRKEEPDKLMRNMNFSVPYKIANVMCCKAASFIQKPYFSKNIGLREFVSKGLYLIPYIIFKLDKLK